MTKSGISLIAITVMTVSEILYVAIFAIFHDNDAIATIAFNHALPVLIALLPIVFVDRMKSIVSRQASYGFTYGTLMFMLVVYSIWIKEMGQYVASGSPADALIFGILSFYSLIFGCITAFAVIIVTIVSELHKRRNPNKAL